MTTAADVLARCAELDRCSASPHHLERVYLTPEHAAANRLAAGWRAEALAAADDTARARLVLDYVAGMTDRFAQQEHERLVAVS